MIIDGHAHASGDFLDPDNIIRVLNANRVDKVVLVPGERSEHNYSMPNLAGLFPDRDVVPFLNALTKAVFSMSGVAKQLYEENHYVHALAQACPDRVVQFYWVYFQRPDVLQEIERRYCEWHFQGLKFHQCWDAFTVRSSIFESVVEFAVDKSLPIFFHVGSAQEVAALIAFIKQHPEPCFIIAHLFGLERYIEAGLNAENVYFEISAPWGISLKRLNRAIEHFGANRVILGSDTPFGKDNLRLNIQRVKDLAIPEQDRRLILGENLQPLIEGQWR